MGKAKVKGQGREGKNKNVEGNESYLPLPPRARDKKSKGKNVEQSQRFAEDEDDDDSIFDLKMDDSSKEEADSHSEEESDAESDDDDFEGDDDMKALINNLPLKIKQKVLSGNADVSDDEGSYDEDPQNHESWGKKKKIYWTGDTADLEIGQDMADAEEEEEAAKELYKKNQSKLAEGDFYDDDLAADREIGEVEQEETIEKLLKRSKGVKGDGFAGRLESVSLRKATEVTQTETEVLTRDRSQLTDQQKLQLLESHSPELLGLAAELREKLVELRLRINPLTELLNKSADIKTDDEVVAYLRVKQEALLCYCLNAAFYLYLKAQGVSVKNHPVMKQLLRLRYILEKMRSLDGKLQPQVDRLLQLASSGGDGAKSKELEAQSLRPNPSALMARFDRLNDDDDDEDEDEDNSDAASEVEKHPVITQEDNEFEKQRKYVAPKISSAPYSAGESQREKSERKLEQQKRRLKNSEMMQALQEEFGVAPEKVHSSGNSDMGGVAASEMRRLAELDEERREFEESRFVRTTVPRAEKKQAKKAAKLAGRLDNFDDIGDVGELDDLMKAVKNSEFESSDPRSSEGKKSDKLRVKFDESSIKKSLGKLVGKEEKGKKRQIETQSSLEPSDKQEADEYDDLLEQFSKKKKQFIAEKKAHYVPEKRFGGVEELVEDGERRPASYEIIKNKGLTPHRAKANRNPRVKKREMYDKKVKARKGQVQDVKVGMAGSYAGESTGIKANLSKSRKIV